MVTLALFSGQLWNAATGKGVPGYVMFLFEKEDTRMKKKLMAVALTLAMSMTAMLTGCGGNGGSESADADTIKIGVTMPYTGDMAAGAAIEDEGIKPAHSKRPTATIDGKEYQIELIPADNKGEKVEATNAATSLIDQGVCAILGSYSSTPSLGVSQIVKEAGVPAIGLSCTNPAVTAGNEYYFRVCFIDPYQGKVMANYAYNNLGARTAAVATEKGSDYSVGLAQYFKEEFEKLGGTVVEASYQTGDTDFNAQITNLKAGNPDVYFVPSNYTEAAMFVKQAKQAGVTQTILGGDLYGVPEFLTLCGEEANGCQFSTYFDANSNLSDKTAEFVQEYRDANNGKDPAGCTALGYDGYNLLIDSIEKAGSTDPEDIKNALKEADFVGVTGPVKFDENNNPSKAAVIMEVKDNQFSYITEVAAE